MRTLAASIFGCICALAQTPVPGTKPEDKCSVEGTVVNATTGEPVQKARLFLSPLGASRTGSPMQPPPIPQGIS